MSSDGTESSGSGMRRVAGYLGSLAFHVIYVTPIFWFVELLQNQLYWKLTGEPGWTYPLSPYHWFSFESLGLWAGSVTIIWCLNFFWFQRRDVGLVKRMIIAGTVCWAGEWLAGFVAAQVFHHPLQVWTNAPLVYVKFSALFFWWWDVLLYQLLTVDIASLGRPAQAAPERTVSADEPLRPSNSSPSLR